MIDRRNWLRRAGCGFGSLAAAALLQDEVASVAAPARNPLTPRSPHFPAKARSVIFLYMHGGASHIDSFDYRPELERRHGESLPASVNTARNQFNAGLGSILKSPWKFRQYGQSGAWVSDLFPQVGQVADELCTST